MLKRGGRWQALEGLLSGAPISEAQEEASRHRAAGLAHAAPGTVGDVLAAPRVTGVHGGNHRLRPGVAGRRIFLPFRVGCTSEVEDHAECPHDYSAYCTSYGQAQSKKKT